MRVGEEKVEIRTLEGQHLYSHWRSLEKGKRFMQPEHYERRQSVPSWILAARLIEVYGDPDLAQALRRSFPRHFREQSRGLIRLADQFSVQILQEACRRVLRHNCAGFGNIKKTAQHLQQLSAVPEKVQVTATVDVTRLPADLGLEARPAAYYDEAALSGEVSR